MFGSLPHGRALLLCPQESLQTDLIAGGDGEVVITISRLSEALTGWAGSLSLSPASGSSVFTRRPSQASQAQAAPVEGVAVPAGDAAAVILALPLRAWGRIGVE